MATLLSVTPMIPAGANLAEDVRFYAEQLGFELTWQAGNMAGVRRGQGATSLIQTANRLAAEYHSGERALSRG